MYPKNIKICVFLSLGKQVENLNDLVKIGTCSKPPCRLRKNHQIPFEFKFTPGKPTIHNLCAADDF